MPPPKGRVRRSEELSERDVLILDTAALAFREKGFHGVGMDELGTRAGLSGPTLYRHFTGKDEILATLLNAAMDELMAAAAPAGAAPAEELDRALRHHVRFAWGRRDLVVLHQREVGNLVEPWASSFARRMAAYTRAWEGLVSARLPTLGEGRAAALTQACLGTVFSVSTWPARAARVGDAAVVEELVLSLLHDGLNGI